jgi:hypothetical protein
MRRHFWLRCGWRRDSRHTSVSHIGWKISEITLTRAELAQDLTAERPRAARLEQLLRQAQAENAALKTARDAAIRMCAWGSSSRRVTIPSRRDEK